ncbi:MAG TPA: NADH-ubiquinone oxidoreductase-F iron-sulfur binding region domain-containing protein, partial [Acidimicrobiales bacterium]|nr:NADH-ubiquinone oxidoreductase-F iron-sulfur binding region domain-containing protein [Acidimicrobiales bacterium]
MTPDPRSLPRLLASAGSADLAAHVERWGRRPIGRPSLLAQIDACHLNGRGGASFPTARKWAALAGRRDAVVVANGTEGEPASNKDKTLLHYCPHLVIDGLSTAAEAVGAKEAIVCVDQGATAVIRAVTNALSERVHYSQDLVPIRLELTPPGYVTGEEKALIHWLNGGDAKPTFGYLPTEKGVDGRPTIVNNVETLANVALIARFGPEWFNALGVPGSPGTALLTVAGDVGHPAVYEVAYGTPLLDAIRPSRPLANPKAVLVGGYAGTWLPASHLERATIDPASLRAMGGTLGCGSLVVLGERSCGLKATAAIAAWLAGQSAGQCGPCTNGLPAIAEALAELADAARPRDRRAHIERWLDMVAGRGACKHPDGAVRMVASGLKVFAGEI